jgi:hypothetical protein
MSFPYRVFLILEGDEEECFFQTAKDCHLFSDKIELTFQNIRGSGNIAPHFQSARSKGENDCVLCVYDVDNRQNEKGSPFSCVQKDLLRVLGSQRAVDAASLCTNPNILQMFLLCCDPLEKVALKQTSKTTNTMLVNHYWPTIGGEKRNADGQKIKSVYGAEDWQLRTIRDSLVYEKYDMNKLFRNGADLPTDYRGALPGGNLMPFLEALKKGDLTFFETLQNEIESEEDSDDE